MSKIIQPDQPAQHPVVLCFSGHDPSGGAGIQADIESIAAMGAHAATVITALTVQDTKNVQSFKATEAGLFLQQAEVIFDDMPVAAIKIGMTGSAEIVESIGQILDQHPEIPVILDPVLAAGGGLSLAGDDAAAKQALIDALKQQIIPHCQLLTPNIPEALALTGTDNIDAAAAELLKLGTEAVLITGGHGNDEDIEHRLYTADKDVSFRNPRLTGEFHGSGCTLASTIAANLASGQKLNSAVRAGLDFTYRSLEAAQALGRGQLIPKRFNHHHHGSSAVRLISDDASDTTRDERLHGLYAITDEQYIGLYFAPAVEQALKGGARIIQYRNKSTNQSRRLQQAETLRQLCDQYNALLIINDDIELAKEVNADGVHIGRDDTELAQAREKLGTDKIIGVSCYNDIELARKAEEHGADYVAFGAFFSSSIKPEAAEAGLALLQQARDELSIPLCCIGGITADNAAPLLEAGGHMLAVISDVFDQSPEEDGILHAAERLSQLFESE